MDCMATTTQERMTAKEFRELLGRLGISQVEAARRLKVHKQTVSRWATGLIPIAGATLSHILLKLR